MSGITVCLTHDIDRVYKTYQYVTHDLRRLKLKGMCSMFDRTESNPYWAFDQLIEIEERHGVKSTFFFLDETIKPSLFAPQSWKLAYGRYRFTDKPVTKIIRWLDAEGWEIGLHGSFNSFRDEALLRREKKSLECILEKRVRGVRQHYLNLDIPETWERQKRVGFEYDASFGLLGDIGFRENQWQPFIDAASDMFVIPLALMECYLFQKAKNDPEVALQLCLHLIDEAESCNALLVVLWHQRMFNEQEFPGYAWVYDRLIEACLARGAIFKTCGEVYDTARMELAKEMG